MIRCWPVAVVYVLAMFMNGVDSTIVNVALPTIGAEFGVPASATGAVTVGYLISLAVAIPVSGWLGDRFGTKRVFLCAFALFVGASALCSAAGGLTELVVFRVVQGIGGGLVTPVALTMLYRAYPPVRRLRLTRILFLPLALGPALGPVLGGWLTSQFSWRWGFLVNVPVGIALAVFAAVFLAEHREPAAGRFDLRGFLLATTGMAALMYALHLATRGWSAGLPIGLAVGGLLLLALLRVELRQPEPMLRLRLYRDRAFRSAGVVQLCCMAGFAGMLYAFPLLYQEVLHVSAAGTGLTVFPNAVGLMAASQVIGHVCGRLGPRRLIGLALLGAAVAFGLLTTVHAGTDPWLVRAMVFGMGFCIGLANLQLQLSAFATVSPARTGCASTLFSVQRQLGSAAGVALVAGVLAGVGGAVGYRAGMLAAGALALLGAVAAGRIGPSATDSAVATERATDDVRVADHT